MALELEVALLVLVAAALHATWNALVKVSGEQLFIQTMIIGTGSLLAALLLPWLEAPDPASWPFIALSVAIHNVYFAVLLRAYRLGDLSQVYPIARGTSPLLVAVLASPLAGESLSLAQLLGVLLVGGGIASLAGIGRIRSAHERQAVLYALATGLLIAAFTLGDGIGVRRSGSVLSFVAWLTACEVVPIGTYVLLAHGERFVAFTRANAWRGVLGGVMAASAYGVILWAYSRGRLAPISALRETSVVMAALFGSLRLGEPFGLARVIAALVVVLGVGLLNLGT